MKRENLEKTAYISVSAVCLGILFSAFMKYILPALSPFLIGWGAALAVSLPAERLSKKFNFSKKILRALLAVLFTIAFLLTLGALLFSLCDFALRLLSEMTEGDVLYILENGVDPERYPLLKSIPDGLIKGLAELIPSILTSLASSLVRLLTSKAPSLTDGVLRAVMTGVSIFYFSLDLDRINGAVKSLFPEKYREKISSFKSKIFKILCKYAKSYLQIMGITFVIMLIGLLILRVRDALTVAFITALLDLLPLLGVGAVLIPWSIFSFLVGNTPLGAGLLILFAVYTLLREALEPKIFGKSLDLHPIISLVSIYTGYVFFGLLGMIIFPIAAVLLSGLLDKNKSSEIA